MKDSAKETMLSIMIANAEERALIWERIADAYEYQIHCNNERIWEIMGRGIKEENKFGDNVAVRLSIFDWRELCEAVNFGR